jgi:hypothetical protein
LSEAAIIHREGLWSRIKEEMDKYRHNKKNTELREIHLDENRSDEERAEALDRLKLSFSAPESPLANLVTLKGSKYGDSGIYKITQYLEHTDEVKEKIKKKRAETKLAYERGEKVRPAYRDRTDVFRTYGLFEEYALCNQWDWFVTLTLDGSKIGGQEERKNINTFTNICQFIQDINHNILMESAEYAEARKERYRELVESGMSPKKAASNSCKGLKFKEIKTANITDKEIKYLLCREKHKNGAWHFHGLMNIPIEELERIEPKMKRISYWQLPAETRAYAENGQRGYG